MFKIKEQKEINHINQKKAGQKRGMSEKCQTRELWEAVPPQEHEKTSQKPSESTLLKLWQMAKGLHQPSKCLSRRKTTETLHRELRHCNLPLPRLTP